MEIYEQLEKLAKQNVRFFELKPNSKITSRVNPSKYTTNDPAKAVEWLKSGLNIGFPMGPVSDDSNAVHLVAVDVDDHPAHGDTPEKRGSETLEFHALLGEEFPKTFTQQTPTGGRHMIYFCRHSVRQSVDVLGKGSGIDTRCNGGYVVGSGSAIDGTFYTVIDESPIVELPEWFASRLRARRVKPKTVKPNLKINTEIAKKRALQIVSTKKVMGNGECYKTAAQIRDVGVPLDMAKEIMVENWPAGVEPEAIEAVVQNVYNYAKNEEGSDSVENAFDVIPSSSKTENKEEKEAALAKTWVDAINKNYFVLTSTGQIYHETKDNQEGLVLSGLSYQQLRQSVREFNKARIWIEHASRREFEHMAFYPGELPSRFYNFWKGFPVKPSESTDLRAVKSVEMLLEHIKENICDNDEALTTWFMTYLAHMIQKPEEKPGVAIALQGSKGVGKTIVFDIISRMMGIYAAKVASRDQVFGRFNSFQAKRILLVLEEAFWPGDRKADSIMKDMITSSTFQVENKGKDMYEIDDFRRVVVLGNEEQLIYASNDERRYAVFKVRDTRRGDREFFGEILEGMKHGGLELFMHVLSNYPLTNADICVAPDTKGLAEHKVAGLSQFQSFLHESLKDGQIGPSCLWQNRVPISTVYNAFKEAYPRSGEWFRKESMGREMKKILNVKSSPALYEGNITRVYNLPSLEEARQKFSKFLGIKEDWGEDE